ncbi:MAG: hypothetical protein KJ558_16075 [Gammaproteobacteria bacterium]|nr:hypothetical protein [Gammaproteobacteria bacterium]MBU1656307.1 hypothetical protein [Gammaproteobacteria bacterium]MBU1959872.1 hypothetical protein [Gammaproteobacteria bacterium]
MHKFAVAVLLATLPLSSLAGEADIQAQCEQYAIEDRVAADEKEAYMKDCILYLTEEQAAGEGQGQEEAPPAKE